MIRFNDLPDSFKTKSNDETWKEFTIRYNAMIDVLNTQNIDERYSKLTVIIGYDTPEIQ